MGGWILNQLTWTMLEVVQLMKRVKNSGKSLLNIMKRTEKSCFWQYWTTPNIVQENWFEHHHHQHPPNLKLLTNFQNTLGVVPEVIGLVFKLNIVYAVKLQWTAISVMCKSVCVYSCFIKIPVIPFTSHKHYTNLFLMVFVVEYLATQTGGATVNNIFEVRFTDTKIK